ncbi:MAG TPA: Calx-beta domain-containing protein, partial [Acidobacteriota bacterium]
MKLANNSSSGTILRMIRLMIMAALLVAMTIPAQAGFNHSPVRFWSFSEFAAKITDPVQVAGDSQQGGKLNQTFDFGPVVFDVGRPDGIARGEIFSSASGKTFFVFAQAPTGNFHESGSVIGDTAVLDQYQSYEKKKDDATLQINISRIFLNLIDANGFVLLPSECPPGVDCSLIEGSVTFEARVYSLGAGGDFFYTKGVAGISGTQARWQFFAGTSADARTPLWDQNSFIVDMDAQGVGDFSHAIAELFSIHGVTLNVDLSPVLEGELFAVEVRMEARAMNARGRESAASAFIRDPQKVVQALVQTTGLRRLGPPPLPAPPLQSLPPVDCPNGPDPNSGTFQFSAPSYVTGEQAGAFSKVIVTRIDGSVGASSVTLTTSDGSALSGVDYTAVSKTITFSDGDTSPRIVEIPILRDSDPETEESLNLTLSDPICATLGQITQASLTIVDDERVIDDPDTFSLGGTVSGLTGSGLELVNFGGADLVDITANGPFQFPHELASGVPYSVTVGTQPSNPRQVCTVTNGEGTVTDHDITDI